LLPTLIELYRQPFIVGASIVLLDDLGSHVLAVVDHLLAICHESLVIG